MSTGTDAAKKALRKGSFGLNVKPEEDGLKTTAEYSGGVTLHSKSKLRVELGLTTSVKRSQTRRIPNLEIAVKATLKLADATLYSKSQTLNRELAGRALRGAQGLRDRAHRGRDLR